MPRRTTWLTWALSVIRTPVLKRNQCHPEIKPSVPNGGNDKNARYHRISRCRFSAGVSNKKILDINARIFRALADEKFMLITRLDQVFSFCCLVLGYRFFIYQIKIDLSPNLVLLKCSPFYWFFDRAETHESLNSNEGTMNPVFFGFIEKVCLNRAR